MKKLFLFLFIAQLTYGYEYCDPCFWVRPGGLASFGGGAIFWTTCWEEDRYDDDWSLGYRLYTGYEACDWEVYGEYTDFSNKSICDHDDEETRFQWCYLDLLFKHHYRWNCQSELIPYLGWKSLAVKQNYHPDIRSKLTANGLEAGLETNYRVCQGMSAWSKFDLSVLHGRFCEENVRCLPAMAYEVAAGLRYDVEWNSCAGCLTFSADLGYEMHNVRFNNEGFVAHGVTALMGFGF